MKDNYLFNPKDINTLVEEAAADVLQSDIVEGNISDGYASYNGTARNFIIELNNLVNKNTMHLDFVTSGNLSLHNIIELMIIKFGKCQNLYISTWAIKEAAARSILSLHKMGFIEKMYGVFDYRIKSVDLKSFQLIEPYFNKYELTKNHAKVILMQFEETKITILTSANLSNNPRIEAGYISFSRMPYYFHINWMTDVLDGKKVN